MLQGMVNELKHGFTGSQEDYEAWVNSDPELKRLMEAMRDAWGPSVWKAKDKMAYARKKVMKNITRKKIG
jgi:hypothetical protein